MDERLCVWMLRHHPTRNQRDALRELGYQIKQVHPPKRFADADHSWALAREAANGHYPDVAVVKLPPTLLRDFLDLARGFTTVLDAPARSTGPGLDDWEWCGKFFQVHRLQVVRTPWPEGGA